MEDGCGKFDDLRNELMASLSESNNVELTHEQKIMLQMSEEDIKNGNLISQEAMEKRNSEWLDSI